jgi:SET domain-containing protein
MGIFAKRDIQMHEELTFNYNVDRYGYVGSLPSTSATSESLQPRSTKMLLRGA